jgi:hypothetical protein
MNDFLDDWDSLPEDKKEMLISPETSEIIADLKTDLPTALSKMLPELVYNVIIETMSIDSFISVMSVEVDKSLAKKIAERVKKEILSIKPNKKRKQQSDSYREAIE